VSVVSLDLLRACAAGVVAIRAGNPGEQRRRRGRTSFAGADGASL